MVDAILAITVLLVGFALYVWPPRERRFQRLFVATFGALVGSLVGRLFVNPPPIGHIAFVTGGAILFTVVDWLRKSHHPKRSSA